LRHYPAINTTPGPNGAFGGGMLERIFQEPKFRVCCLGAIKLVEAGSGTDMTPTSRKTRALLGYLCIVGKPVGRERLSALLWGDRGDEQARASLRQAIYELRSLLGGDRLLKVERDTVAIGDDVGTDVAEILATAGSGDLEQLAQALSAWRGDFFEDLPSIDSSFDSWLQAERPRVQESLVSAATEAAKSGMERGESDAARKIVNLLQQHDGTNEVALRLGLRLDYRAGDSGALHRRYERFRELLKSELDAAPAAESQRLFDELTAPSAKQPDATTVSEANTIEQPAGATRQIGESEPDTATPVIVPTAGDADVQTGSSDARVRAGRLKRTVAIAVVVACLCVIGIAIWRILPSRQEPLLAIMPFQNLSTDRAARTLAAGISDEIATSLKQTGRIRIASISSDRDAGAPHPPAATHVLSGSVERIGDRIHVIAQLMDIRDDDVIWSHAYDRAMEQAPELRRDIGSQITGALTRLLSSGSFGDALHLSSAAHDHYLKGRELLLRNDPREAGAELETSIGLAPDFASAWSTLATARLLLATNLFAGREKSSAPPVANAARMAAERALALDPGNGEALGILAMLIPASHLEEIDRRFQRALRSAPDNAQLLGWHGEFLMFVGRNHEALNELKRAYILNSAIPSIAPDLVRASLNTGRIDEARDVMDLVDREHDDRLRVPFYFLRLKYFLYKHDWFGLATYLNTPPAHLSPAVAGFFGLCRQTAIAFATHQTDKFEGLRTRWRSEPPVDLDDAVEFLSALGDDDAALAMVQSAVTSRRNTVFLSDPQWETLFAPDLVPLRSDARVPVLLAQWGLTDYWRATNHPPDYTR
jgi:DNA-binding SARP family transcriptional activator/TolB-like protein